MATLHDLQARIVDKETAGIFRALVAAMEFAVAAYAKTGRLEFPPKFNEDMARALGDLWATSITVTGHNVIDSLNFTLGVKQDGLFEEVLADYIARFGAEAVAQITDTTRVQLQRLIEAGINEGLTNDEIVENMREAIPSIGRTRATIITRTETHSASGFANRSVAKSTGLELTKEWISVEDARTRDGIDGDVFNHRIMNGVTIPIDDEYQVPTKFGTTESVTFPGDPKASAGNRINCRCVEGYSVVE